MAGAGVRMDDHGATASGVSTVAPPEREPLSVAAVDEGLRWPDPDDCCDGGVTCEPLAGPFPLVGADVPADTAA